jgi:hypothetical protein
MQLGGIAAASLMGLRGSSRDFEAEAKDARGGSTTSQRYSKFAPSLHGETVVRGRAPRQRAPPCLQAAIYRE